VGVAGFFLVGSGGVVDLRLLTEDCDLLVEEGVVDLCVVDLAVLGVDALRGFGGGVLEEIGGLEVWDGVALLGLTGGVMPLLGEEAELLFCRLLDFDLL